MALEIILVCLKYKAIMWTFDKIKHFFISIHYGFFLRKITEYTKRFFLTMDKMLKCIYSRYMTGVGKWTMIKLNLCAKKIEMKS